MPLLQPTSAIFSQKLPHRQIKKLIEKSDIFKEYFSGIELLDTAKDKMIYDQNVSKYFVRASDAKLPTFL